MDMNGFEFGFCSRRYRENADKNRVKEKMVCSEVS